MADRRATITEVDREAAHVICRSRCRFVFGVEEYHGSLCTDIAQALADTREAAETRAGILVRAGESVHEFGAHDERCLKLPVWSCHPECVVHIVGRALAEYAEAGKASAPAVRR